MLRYISPVITNTNITICKARRILYIMKATGIVRRIEARVIIGQTVK